MLIYDNQLFIALTETWLHDHKDAEVSIEKYSIFRQDRPSRKTKGRHIGGVALYINNSWAPDAEPVLKYSNRAVDILSVYIPSRNILLTVIYRQPDDSPHGYPSTNSDLIDVINKLTKIMADFPSPCPDFLVMGDMNLPHVTYDTWNQDILKPGSSRDEQNMISTVKTLASEFFLEQVIDMPTHIEGNMLDLVFTNNASSLHSSVSNKTAREISDHHIVTCKTLYCNPQIKRTTHSESDTEPYNFDRFNFFSDSVEWEKINYELSSYSWDEDFSICTHTEMVNKLIEVCYNIACKYVPHKKSKRNGHKAKIPKDRNALMRRRTKIHKQLNSEISAQRQNNLHHELVEIELSLQSSYQEERSKQEKYAVSAIKRNVKHFYSYASKFSKIRQGIGPLTDPQLKTVSCPHAMANLLSTQYASVWTTPNNRADDVSNSVPDTHPNISDILFSSDDIEKAIDELKANASPGPDKFPAVLLKKCKKSLSLPLQMLWRKSVDNSEIKQTQKSANVIPIHKGGSKAIPKNYRPIALTSHLIKIFEKVIRNALVSYLEKYNLLNMSQHGFRIGRSCISQLLEHFDKITRLLEEGHDVDIVYVDFAKAFDKVDINIAMRKIRSLGITGILADWIECFLKNRTQQVIVNSAKSSSEYVLSGVPQGSVLGPLIFLILIGDIDKDIAQSFLSSFADDTRIGRQIDNIEDRNALQKDLETVYTWCNSNNMAFNSDKFEHMSYKASNKQPEFKPEYTDNTGKTIQTSENVKDLGVYMSSNASFNHHINVTASKARQMCGWILRTFTTRAKLPMLTLYKSLVLSQLDYCSQLWDPHTVRDIQTLELVQRSFIRKISNMWNLSYWEQLHHLQLYSLQRRRERYIIIYVWKILEKMVPPVGSISSTNHIRHGRQCRVPIVKSSASAAVKSIRYASFGIHGPRLFNGLPSEIRNMTGCSLESFKSSLDKYLRQIPDEPLIPGYTAYRKAESNSLHHMNTHKL